VRRITRRRVKGPADFTAEHASYIALWNARATHHHFYLLGAQHRSGMWVEYLRWLQQQSQLFLRPAYTEEGIAELLDSDGDNEIVDEYDQLTRQGTVEPEHGPFQNYVVFIFSYFNCLLTLKSKFLIITNVAQATQLGQLENEASDALRHSPNSITSYNALCAFIEVSMVSISLIHLNISLNYLYCHLFLCTGSARVLDD
jgi:hypothetical protein